MSQRSYHCVVSFAFSLLFVCSAAAQDLKDWQNAVNYMQDEKGCYSIPYSDRQNSCHTKQSEVDKWCKNSGPYNCDDIDPRTLQWDIERLKTQMAELKAENDKLEQAKRDVETKLKDIDPKITSLDTQVQEGTKSANDRLYIAKACRDARSSVQEIFNGVRESANRESDPEVVPLAQRLIAWWDPRYRTHEQAVRDANTAIGTCERVLYEIGRLPDLRKL